MADDRIYRAYLLDLKERISKCKPPAEQFPWEFRNETEKRELCDKIKSMREYEENKWTAEICSVADEIFHEALAKSLCHVPPERYTDGGMTYRWMMYHNVQVVISCVLGIIILFLATLFYHFASKNPVSDEAFEVLSYVTMQAFMALSTNTGVAVYLMYVSFSHKDYSESASKLLLDIRDLIRHLMNLKKSIGVDNKGVSQELLDVLEPFAQESLYNILEYGYIAKSDVSQVVKKAETILGRALWKEATSPQHMFPGLRDSFKTRKEPTTFVEDDDLMVKTIWRDATSAEQMFPVLKDPFKAAEKPATVIADEDLIEQLQERLRRLEEMVRP